MTVFLFVTLELSSALRDIFAGRCKVSIKLEHPLKVRNSLPIPTPTKSLPSQSVYARTLSTTANCWDTSTTQSEMHGMSVFKTRCLN